MEGLLSRRGYVHLVDSVCFSARQKGLMCCSLQIGQASGVWKLRFRCFQGALPADVPPYLLTGRQKSSHAGLLIYTGSASWVRGTELFICTAHILPFLSIADVSQFPAEALIMLWFLLEYWWFPRKAQLLF